MKKTSMAAVLAGIVMMTALAGGCQPKSSSTDDNNSPTIQPSLSTRNPFTDASGDYKTQEPNAGYVGKTNDNGEKLCIAEFARATYDASIKSPAYFFVDNLEDFQELITSKGITLESSSKKGGIYNEEFFSTHTVIMVALPYSSGSTKSVLKAVDLDDGTVKIYITSDLYKVGTTDMATFYGIISLDNSVFGEAVGFEVYLNNSLINENGSSSTEK